MVVPGCRHRAHWCNGGQSNTGGAGSWCNACWRTVHHHSGAMCPPPGAPDWRDTRVGRRVNMYRPDLTPHGDDAADCDKDLKFFGSYLSLGEGEFGQFSCNQAEK